MTGEGRVPDPVAEGYELAGDAGKSSTGGRGARLSQKLAVLRFERHVGLGPYGDVTGDEDTDRARTPRPSRVGGNRFT